jgi:hypothetical protein
MVSFNLFKLVSEAQIWSKLSHAVRFGEFLKVATSESESDVLRGSACSCAFTA